MLIWKENHPSTMSCFLKRFFSIQTWLPILKQSKEILLPPDLLNIVWGYAIPLFTSGDRIVETHTDYIHWTIENQYNQYTWKSIDQHYIYDIIDIAYCSRHDEWVYIGQQLWVRPKNKIEDYGEGWTLSEIEILNPPIYKKNKCIQVDDRKISLYNSSYLYTRLR